MLLSLALHYERTPASNGRVFRGQVRSKLRDNLLAEAKAAFCLARIGFRIVEWEPPGEDGKTGDFSCAYNESPSIFVEVKQPGWQAEWMPLKVASWKALSADEQKLLNERVKQSKYSSEAGAGGAVTSHIAAMKVVRRNVLPKLKNICPNLAVVVSDATCNPVGVPTLDADVRREFCYPDHDPDIGDDKHSYERLGGVLFIQPEAGYSIVFIENPNALPACALPSQVSTLLERLRA